MTIFTLVQQIFGLLAMPLEQTMTFVSNLSNSLILPNFENPLGTKGAISLEVSKPFLKICQFARELDPVLSRTLLQCVYSNPNKGKRIILS